MKAIDRPFTKIINGTMQFVIPVFQRDYSWTEANCDQLWKDVIRIAADAHRAALLLSLVQTCKHLDVEPFAYLRDVIERVSTHPMSRILELTPREWKRLRQQSTSPAVAAA